MHINWKFDWKCRILAEMNLYWKLLASQERAQYVADLILQYHNWKWKILNEFNMESPPGISTENSHLWKPTSNFENSIQPVLTLWTILQHQRQTVKLGIMLIKNSPFPFYNLFSLICHFESHFNVIMVATYLINTSWRHHSNELTINESL